MRSREHVRAAMAQAHRQGYNRAMREVRRRLDFVDGLLIGALVAWPVAVGLTWWWRG